MLQGTGFPMGRVSVIDTVSRCKRESFPVISDMSMTKCRDRG